MKAFALCRAGKWIIAPDGDGQPIPPTLALGDDPALAWRSPTLDLAIERQQLLKILQGWTTEVRVIQP